MPGICDCIETMGKQLTVSNRAAPTRHSQRLISTNLTNIKQTPSRLWDNGRLDESNKFRSKIVAEKVLFVVSFGYSTDT